MGVVYRAQDPKIGRTLAIKAIRLNELTDLEERGRMRERLFREAQSAGILSHPNIVTIYDVSEEDGLAYIFMEFVNGMALDEMLRATPPPTGSLMMDLLGQTAAALDYAHKNGIIHRDIKPANIMVNDGVTAKVCDFGVAKIVSQQMTQAGLLMGTPSYMSPEQIEGRPMDGRSDQFALAVMVFDILTKEKPFAGDSLPILLYKICRADPPSASELNTTLGIWVDPVLRKALAKNPDDRYPSCSAFIAELRRALDERPGWMLPGKGFPGEDGTTNSGRIPTGGVTAGSSVRSGGILAPPVPPQPPQFVPQRPPTNPAFQASSPSLPPAHLQSQGAMPPPPSLRQTEAISLPRSRVEAKKTSPLLWIAPVLLALGGGGYFAYQKFSEAKPVAVDPTESSRTKDEPAKESPKAETVRPAETPKRPAEVPVPVAKEPIKGEEPRPVRVETDRPKAGGPFAVHFGGNPTGATVTVDGDGSLSCKTPCTVEMPKGRHTLTAMLDGFANITRSFEVSGESTVPVDLAEAVGFLIVNSTPPGATVSINGQDRPDKTPARFKLRPGTYQLVVSHDGQRDTPTAIVKDGVTLTVNVNFQ